MAVYIFKKTHVSPEIISLDAAKNHLKVDTTDDDDLITDLIQAAIEAAENYTGSSINEAKFDVHFESFINNFEIKLFPIQTIDAVTYKDDADADQTVTDVELLPIDKYGSKIHYTDFDAIPTQKEGTRIIVGLTTGYASGKVPKAIQSAIKLIIGDLYENRQDRADKLPKRSESLLRKYRFYHS